MSQPYPTRDPFGVTPLYYHRRTLQTAPSVHTLCDASAPDSASLSEYLAFGEVWREEATFLADVARVPPGASLVEGEVHRATPRWPSTLTGLSGGRLVAAFWDSFAAAVERCVGGAKEVVVSLSGGLDSAALAAAAVERVGPSRVRAVTMGFERDLEDEEPRCARMTADHLGIAWTFVPADQTELGGQWPTSRIWPVEPIAASRVAWDQQMPGEDGVILWGLGGDSLLRGNRRHYRDRLRRGEFLEALGDVVLSTVVHGRRPALSLRRARPELPALPGWLRADAPGIGEAAAMRRDLPGTWHRGVDELLAPAWSYYFETEAPENTRAPHRYVYPFFDVELARFMATVPTAPWSVDKEILRAALRGRVPEEVRLRQKRPVHGEPMVTLGAELVTQCRQLIGSGAGDRYVARGTAEMFRPGLHPWSAIAPLMRIAAVARWLAV